ncbi:MAG TPA: DUF58 domain-containing protein [Phnomibacter sp.]|nr:DUF58 domain-containing protein [Phnomibacter sp.]
MNKSTWRQRLSYISLFIPVRLYFLLFLAAAALALWWIRRQQPVEPNVTGDLLTLLVKAGFATAFLLFGLSILSVLVPFLWFTYKTKTRQVTVNIDNAEEASSRKIGRRINMDIEPLLKPFFGFLYFRFIYDDVKLSPKFSLIQKKGNVRWFSARQSGWYHWPLPAIREYDVQELVVYFEDLFQFFSFSMRLPVKQSFFTKPKSLVAKQQPISPQRTEEENVRIEELKRIEGEYLNYKNFEDNDDVRRIVWKIYARNKELVVRIPETMDPFASHIYMYASFFDSLHMPDNYLVNTRGLDYFKNACWTVYAQLVKDGRMVKFVTDQPIPNRHFSQVGEQVEYALAASNWHSKADLLSIVPPKGHALVCISSISAATQVEQLLQRQQQKTTVVMVSLSRGLKRNMIGNWIRWIFVQPGSDFEKQGFTEIRRYSTIRKMKSNEQLIWDILKKHGVPVVTLS